MAALLVDGKQQDKIIYILLISFQLCAFFHVIVKNIYIKPTKNNKTLKKIKCLQKNKNKKSNSLIPETVKGGGIAAFAYLLGLAKRALAKMRRTRQIRADNIDKPKPNPRKVGMSF